MDGEAERRDVRAQGLVRQANWQKVGGASPLERRSNRTTFLADERERVLWRFVDMFVEYVFQGECACSTGSLFSTSDAPLLRHLQCVLPVQSFDELFESLTLRHRRDVIADLPDQR